eukprot:Plantae.Rhodophyta-Hildenbrandia_rubra.ctg1906.p1 GENE.Plantae.Rhodophyta-Hildenbrandia_rubra.ctg1906~~Plantae.Rhodophyta-Hildenbrandia_rubra.ctg1906.p1  ORF type:complete len:731 (-),score=140.71 Plantae.Rhodophyta-Hildenbrandia_rubra.ctg1906:2660-4744(-)
MGNPSGTGHAMSMAQSAGVGNFKNDSFGNNMMAGGSPGRIPNMNNTNPAHLYAMEQAKTTSRQRQTLMKANPHAGLPPVHGGNQGVGPGAGANSGAQQRSNAGSQQLKSAIQAALSVGVRKEDIYSFIRSHQARLMKAGVCHRPQQLKVITTNLYAQTRDVLKKRQEVRGREDAFFAKLQEMKTKYKHVLVKLKPMIDKLQERRKPPVSKESFQRHLNDCFNLLNLQRTTPLSQKLTMGLLQRADKFMAQVIIVYSKYMRDMISYTGPHTGTRTVLLARFEDQIGKFARELEREAQMKQSPQLQTRGAASQMVQNGAESLGSSRIAGVASGGGLPGPQGFGNLSKAQLASMVANNPQLAQNPLFQQAQQAQNRDVPLANQALQNQAGHANMNSGQLPPPLLNRMDPNHMALLQAQRVQAQERGQLNMNPYGVNQSHNSMEDSGSKANAAALIPQRIAQLEIDVKTAVKEATMLEKYVDAEVKNAKTERIQNTLAALQTDNDENKANEMSETEERGVKRRSSDAHTNVDNVPLEKGGVIESKGVFECSSDQGLRLAKRIKTEKTDIRFLKAAVEAECRAAVAKNPILVVSIEEEFGFPVVSALLKIDSIKLPKLVVSVERGYPRKGGAAYGFERPPLGFTGILEELRGRFKRAVQASPANNYTVASLLNAWAREADAVCNDSRMAKAQENYDKSE